MILLIMVCASSLATSKHHDFLSDTPLVNLTHIVYNAILYCGPTFVCDKTYLAQFGIPENNGNNFSICGSCFCDDYCFADEDVSPCCPDMYFKYGFTECTDFTVKAGFLEPKLHAVIGLCPPDADASVVKNCTRDRSEEELLQTPPIYSYATKRTYKNRYCALCNNITDFYEWKLEFACPEKTDFNHLSSYEEISLLTKQKNCSIIFSTYHEPDECKPSTQETISSCNVSGTWRHYDRQIEMACLSAYHTSILFRNIFCAICNPPTFDLITSRLNTPCSNVNYNLSCLKLSGIEASFPYKNHFCLMCDHNVSTINLEEISMNERTSETYEEARLGNPSETYEARLDNPFVTKLSFTFNSNHLKNYIKQVMKYDNASSNGLQNSIIPLNVTNLVRASFALSGTGSCDSELLPLSTKHLQQACSCKLGCISSCCDDFAMIQPWICITEHHPSQKSYLGIGGCLKNSEMYARLCIDRNSSDFYKMIPVAATSENRETYANIFCYLCNQKHVNDQVIETVMLNVTVWGLVIQCKGYINYRYFSRLQDFINVADLNNCFMQFDASDKAVLCNPPNSRVKHVISKCETNVTLTLEDNEDVKNACEQTEDYRFPKVLYNDTVYKNKFCIMCNNVKPTAQNETCEVINNLTASLNKTCLEFPRIAVCSNFRNRFCEMCYDEWPHQCVSLYDESEGEVTNPVDPSPSPNPITDVFRFAFSILSYDHEQTDSTIERQDCLSSQVYDDYLVSFSF